MKKNNRKDILFLIKFGKRKHLEALLNQGELYFNSPKSYNKIKKINSEQGDENEGAILIENVKSVQLTYYHPKLGEIKFKPVPNKLAKVTQFNHNFLTCSFYMVTRKDFENSNILKIDTRMSNFNEYALIISNPKRLIDSVIECAEKENLELIAKKVDYKDLTTEGRIEIDPFTKKNDHFYQKEYRFVIKNCIESSKLIKIEKIGDNGEIVPSKQMAELKIEFKK